MRAAFFHGLLSLCLISSSASQTASEGTWTDITPDTEGVSVRSAFDVLPDGRLVLWGDVPWMSDDGDSWDLLFEQPIRDSARLVADEAGALWVLDSALGRVFLVEDGRLSLERDTPAGARLSLASTPAGTLWLSAAGRRAGGAFSRTSSLVQSDDGGESWQLRSNQRLLEIFSPFGNDRLVALRDNLLSDIPELSTSDDGGRSWTTRLPEATELYTDPRFPNVLWAILERPSGSPPLLSRTLFQSQDRGLTWTRIDLPLWTAFTVASSGLLALRGDGVTEDFEGQLVRSDGFSPWQPVDSAEAANAVFSSSDGETVALFGLEPSTSYQLSTDGGQSFSRQRLPQRGIPTGVAALPNSGKIVTSTGVSLDRGATWQPSESRSFDRIEALTPTTILGSSADFSGLLELGISDDGGLSFEDILPTSLGDSLFIAGDVGPGGSPVLFLLVGATCQIFESSDLGATWQPTDLECPDPSSRRLIYSFDARVVGSGRQALVLSYLTGFGSSPGGVSDSLLLLTSGLEPVELDGLAGGFLRESVAFDGDDVVLLGPRSERTEDLGESWQVFPGQPRERILAWHRSRTNPSLHFAASERGAYRSTDGGQTFQLIAGSDDAEIVDLQLESDSSVLVLTANGLYRWQSAECVPGPTSLCLGDRFHVAISFSAGGPLRAAKSFPLTEDTGAFWFFEKNNLELIVKVLDGCQVNGHFWVFTAGLTDVATRIVVTDLANGARWTDEHPGGLPFPPGAEVNAFECTAAAP